MNKLIRGALLCSFVVGGFSLLFHYVSVSPHDWGAVVLWLPVYISPILGIAGWSWLSERGKK